MTTLVGTQSDFVDALKALVELDYDAVEAYEAAINRLENAQYKAKLQEFKADHLRHIKDLSALLKSHGHEAPSGPDLKQLLTKGKVILASMVGDEMILSAMSTNEDDTNTAYERVLNHEDKWSDAYELLQHGLKDERRHKDWIEATLKAGK